MKTISGPEITKEQFEYALSRVEELMDCETDSKDAKDLDIFSTIVEIYEEIIYPIGVEEEEFAQMQLCTHREYINWCKDKRDGDNKPNFMKWMLNCIEEEKDLVMGQFGVEKRLIGDGKDDGK